MPHSELKEMLRTVIQEELLPVHQELRQVSSRLDRLEKGQQKTHKDMASFKRELRALWTDIKKLDNRLSIQEQRTVR